jgi:TRAP-type transport system periplasmic protein
MKAMRKVSIALFFLFILVGIAFLSMADAQSKPLIIKASHLQPPTHPWGIAMKRYAESVATATQGKVKIELYPSAQLTGGNEKTMVEQLMMGTQQMGLFPSSLPGDKFLVTELPFLFSNRQKIYEVLDGKVGQELLGMYEQPGLKAFSFWENGYHQFTNSKRPITKPDDMKGLKMRVPMTPCILESVKALGATPVPISLGELYMALQQGTADGQQNPLSTIYSNKYYEVQKYLTMIGYIWNPLVLGMNKSFYDSLPSDVQKVLAEKGREVATYERGLIQEEDKILEKKLAELGMKITVLNREQIALFREATKGVAQKMEPLIGKDLIKKFQDAAKN